MTHTSIHIVPINLQTPNSRPILIYKAFSFPANNRSDFKLEVSCDGTQKAIHD